MGRLSAQRREQMEKRKGKGYPVVHFQLDWYRRVYVVHGLVGVARSRRLC